MSTRIGLWIDHRKAVVVAMVNGGEESQIVILSQVESQPGRAGGKHATTPYEAQQVPADDSRQRRFTGQLDIYYDAVIACVRHAERILILGPGEAKIELRKRLVQAGICGRIEETETADSMTDRQVAAEVRRHFREDQGDLPRKRGAFVNLQRI